MAQKQRPLKVFLSHAHSDSSVVRDLYHQLRNDHVDVWLDQENLLPGQDWDFEIQKAVREADVVVVCLSRQFNQVGYRQKEVRLALDTAMEQPEGEIFIIPARLEECDSLESLRKWQWVDLFDPNGYGKLLMAFRTRANHIGAILQDAPALQARPSLLKVSLDFDKIVKDYEDSFETFFDQQHGAVIEHGRENNLPRFIYTEATAYAVTDCLLLHKLTGEHKYLDRAKTCAEWISHAIDPLAGGALTRYFFEHDDEPEYVATSFFGRRIYSFDTAVCIEALLALYSRTNEAWLLKDAKTMGRFLLEKAFSPDGTLTAVYDASTDTCITNERANEWSKQFGPFHTRVAQVFTLLSKLEDGEQKARYLDAAVRICDTLIAKRFFGKGYFETSEDKIALHPLAYAAEGLFYTGLYLDNDKYVPKRDEYMGKARSIVVWLLKLLEKYPNGELPQIISAGDSPLPNTRFRTDSLAQIVALAADMHRRGYLDKINYDKSEILVQKILEMKCDASYFGKQTSQKFFRYGYYYHEKDTSLNGVEAKTLSYWTNMFCFHSLFKYHLSQILDQVVVVVLAGGKGTRCWPLSCETKPKPLSKSILGSSSLLQETIRRYTFDSFIAPQNIYIIANESSLAETCIQAHEVGIPDSNVIVDDGKEDSSIRAVFCGLERMPNHFKGDRIIIVSMSDNLFGPYESFQSAVTTALLIASSRPCIVSIGQSIDIQSDRDSRFGHIHYNDVSQIGSYNAYAASAFIEKPSEAALSDLANSGGSWAWECGTPIFQEKYFHQKVEELLLQRTVYSGKLADDLLSKVDSKGNKLDLVVSLLPPQTKFDDFGVPGRNVFQYFRQPGDTNVIRGEAPNVKALCCQGNLVISDSLPIQLYGLTDYLIVDSSAANATVVMPLEKAGDLDNLYNSLGNQRPSKVFVTGTKIKGKSFEIAPELTSELDRGQITQRLLEQFQKNNVILTRQAWIEVDRPGSMWTIVDKGTGYFIQHKNHSLEVSAEPVYTAAPECENPHVVSSFGCAVLSNTGNDNISLRRTRSGIVITNQDYPSLIDKDFDGLLTKEQEEPLIVRHLLDVAMLAESLLMPGNIALTKNAKWLLGRLCLYHDYGGYLSEQGVEKEERYIKYIKNITKIDRRLLDSRVLEELIRSTSDPSEKESPWLYNDHVNSAVELLRLKYKFISDDMRDILIFLLQNQEPPTQYASFRAGYDKQNFDIPLGEIDEVFAIFKFSEIIANGKWTSKRLSTGLLDSSLLQLKGKKDPLIEDFPEIVSFAVDWLRRADIDPKRYIEALNYLIEKDHRFFNSIINRLQGEIPPLACDRIYRNLLTCNPSNVESMLKESLYADMQVFKQDRFQRMQLQNLPGLIQKIRRIVNIPALPTNVELEVFDDCVQDFLHTNRSIFRKEEN